MSQETPSSASAPLVKRHPLAQVDFTLLGGEHTNTLIAALFTAISLEMTSGDAVYLAMMRAVSLAMDAGVPEKVTTDFLTKIDAAMSAARKTNPMAWS